MPIDEAPRSRRVTDRATPPPHAIAPPTRKYERGRQHGPAQGLQCRSTVVASLKVHASALPNPYHGISTIRDIAALSNTVDESESLLDTQRNGFM